ncbi:L-aspartate oxidase [Halanaerobaculum tunisiense]
MISRYLVNFDLANVKQVKNDYIVIGTGVAGLVSALKLSESNNVTLLTKGELSECNTEQAQGGVAAAIAKDDTVTSHVTDTLQAGAGLCNPQAVKELVTEGKEQIEKLIDLGMRFDQVNKELALTKEGGHSCSRVLHAGGDATGSELRSFLTNQVLAVENIDLQNRFVIDLLTKDGECCGVLTYNSQEGLVAYLGQAVILATGGAGQLYPVTSNSDVVTGDGVAMAYRAGVEVMDLEFIQFHPTTLQLPNGPNFLISEAMRGEGAVLRNQAGERFMSQEHKLADLAPRDIVARAIYRQMQGADMDYVYLDATDLEANFVQERFPTIYQTCLEAGIDITTDYIPVAPAAHYLMGGIKTNQVGETNLDRLYACGETACVGVHGANRLASNSLLEGLVYGARVAKAADKSPTRDLEVDISSNQQINKSKPLAKVKSQLHNIMVDRVGIVRNKSDLEEALDSLKELLTNLRYNFSVPDRWEVQNLLLVAYLVVKSALLREESRGAHYRKGIPYSKPQWKKHIVFQEEEWEELGLEF